MGQNPLKHRANEINQIILNQQKCFYRLRRLPIENGSAFPYVITLKKLRDKTLEEQIDEYYTMFKNALMDDEVLLTDNRCFSIKGNGYSIIYCIEAYRRSADKIGYVENGKVSSSLIRRMSCERAFQLLRKNRVYKYDSFIVNHMNSEQYKIKYPNPADRFVAILNEYKQLYITTK